MNEKEQATAGELVWHRQGARLLSEAFNRIAEAAAVAANYIMRLSHACLEEAKDVQDVIKDPKNRRIVHLWRHAKKERTRKKNFRRLVKLLKEAKR